MSAKLSRCPKKCRPVVNTSESWWYDMRGGVEVYVYVKGVGSVGCSIKRSALARYLKRSAP